MDTVPTRFCRDAVGLGRRELAWRALPLRPQSYQVDVRMPTRAGRQLSGVHQIVRQVDRSAARPFAGRLSSTNRDRFEGVLDRPGLAGFCLRRQPRRCASDTEKRSSLLSKIETFPRCAEKRRRTRRGGRTVAKRKREQRERKANVPRIWLTTLWHVGAGLPWNWRIGPSDSSERGHLVGMLATMPVGALLAADAGFVGYELWQLIAAAKLEMLVRVGGNVRLLKKLGYVRERNGLVYLWPDQAAKKRLPPLVLRLIVVQGERQPVYLVTSVTDPCQLSDQAAAEIYGRRWDIELFYRNYKQTFGRRKLRSHNPDNAAVEMEWSLLGMWAMGLHSHYHLASQGIPPEKISFAGVLRAYRRPLREYRCRPEPGESLSDLLDRAIIDDYHRQNKASRDYPQKKPDRQATGPPKIFRATKQQIAMAKQVRKDASKKRLTA